MLSFSWISIETVKKCLTRRLPPNIVAPPASQRHLLHKCTTKTHTAPPLLYLTIAKHQDLLLVQPSDDPQPCPSIKIWGFALHAFTLRKFGVGRVAILLGGEIWVIFMGWWIGCGGRSLCLAFSRTLDGVA